MSAHTNRKNIMLPPILYCGATENLQDVLDDDWIIGILSHDFALILVDEIEVIEEELNTDTKYREEFLKAKNMQRIQSFGSICNIPAGKNETIEIGVIRYGKGSWGLQAYFIIPEEDIVDESLEFSPTEEEWEDLFKSFPIDAKYSKPKVKEKVFEAVQVINAEDKKRFVEQFNRTLPRYLVDWEHPNVFHDENYLMRVAFRKTNDNRWSISPRFIIALERVLQDIEEEK
nr:MAG TPA: hypothetical protein [Caudoviricetes sp.]